MPPASLLIWLFIRASLLPHEPASLALPSSPLPSSRSAYGWLETTAPQVISGAFDAGGLLVGRTAKIGVHGSSANDATFRFAGLDATSALRPGTPIVLPDVVGAASMDVTRMASDISQNAPGPVVDWKPMDGSQRIGLIEGFVMPSRFAVTPSATGAQPVAELRTFADGSVVLAGALSPNRSSAALSAHWSRAQGVDRSFRSGRLPASQPQPSIIEISSLALMGQITFTPRAGDRASLTYVMQRTGISVPEHATTVVAGDSITGRSELDPETHGALQAGWQRRLQNGISVRGAAGYQWMQVGERTPATLIEMDSAFDGAVFPRAFSPDGKEHVIRAGLDLAKSFRAAGLSHTLQAGGSADWSTMTPQLAQAGGVYERVNGTLARIWRIDVPATAPEWKTSTSGAHVKDRIGSESNWVEVGIRYDRLHGDNGGATPIAWSNLFPHAAIEIFDQASGVRVFGTYTRSGARLPAMALAWGDVNAPTARVYRQLDSDPSPVLVARVGPGASGGLTAISPNLVRPVYNTVMGGIKYERPRFTFGVAAVIRSTAHTIGAVGDTPSNYVPVSQPDQNADFSDAGDDQQLTAYNRKTQTFGLDSYTLTNLPTAGKDAIYALDITAQFRGTRTRLAFSAAAVASRGPAASRGFRADENDPMLIGEAFANPNATVNASGGRTFFDRGYVGKIAGVFNLPGRVELGVVARYQDGQPFSRIAIFDNLNQGPEAVMAYRNGRPTRFTFISTTDVRLQRTSAWGGKQLTLIVDGFNVFNIGREVAEYVIGDANFRQTSLIEPPRTIRVGVRVAF